MDTLPLEIIKKIRLYAHPRLSDQLKKDIHGNKYSLYNSTGNVVPNLCKLFIVNSIS